MNRLINCFKAVVLYTSLFSGTIAMAQPETGKLLGQLNLRNSQRAEIQAVLTGGMQSLNALNNELSKLEAIIGTDESNPEIEQMQRALVEQRLRLAQSIVLEILGVLDEEQLSKFDFGLLTESLPSAGPDKSTWEQEI